MTKRVRRYKPMSPAKVTAAHIAQELSGTESVARITVNAVMVVPPGTTLEGPELLRLPSGELLTGWVQMVKLTQNNPGWKNLTDKQLLRDHRIRQFNHQACEIDITIEPKL